VVIEDGSRISDTGIAVLAGLPSLRELIITNAPLITDTSLLAMGKKKEMRILYLFSCPSLSERAKRELTRALPGCEVLFE
jgi:hypothetical protein